MIKIYLRSFCICLLFVMAMGTAYAEDLKIGIVDYEKIMGQSIAAQRLRAEYFKEVEESEKKILEKQKQAKALQDEINNTWKELTPAVLSEKRERYEREVKELNRMVNDYQEDKTVSQTYISQQLTNEIDAVVREYCERENFTYIVAAAQVIAFSDVVDVTDQILQRYDATQKTE